MEVGRAGRESSFAEEREREREKGSCGWLTLGFEFNPGSRNDSGGGRVARHGHDRGTPSALRTVVAPASDVLEPGSRAAVLDDGNTGDATDVDRGGGKRRGGSEGEQVVPLDGRGRACCRRGACLESELSGALWSVLLRPGLKLL